MHSKAKKIKYVEVVGRKDDAVKESLSRTRKIIVNKFRKLHMDRVSNERKREQKFAPLTDSLRKMFSRKEEITRNHHLNMQNNLDELERMEIDPTEIDNLMQPPQHAPPPPPVPPRQQRNYPTPHHAMIQYKINNQLRIKT